MTVTFRSILKQIFGGKGGRSRKFLQNLPQVSVSLVLHWRQTTVVFVMLVRSGFMHDYGRPA